MSNVLTSDTRSVRCISCTRTDIAYRSSRITRVVP